MDFFRRHAPFVSGRRIALLVLGLSLLSPGRAEAQRSAATDTLRLDVVRAAAADRDPRAVQPDLLARASALRRAALRGSRLPHLTVSGQGTLQNEVIKIPLDIPGQQFPSPPHEQFRAQFEADWTVFDGGQVRRRLAAEEARLAEDLAGVSVTLYRLREAATEAYFAALLSESAARTLGSTADALETRLRLIRRQVEEGAMLGSAAAALEAEALQVRQQIAEREAARTTALDVLADLTGLPAALDVPLALPDYAADIDRSLRLLDSADAADLGRPELERFSEAGARAEAEARALESRLRPTVSLFGQAGVGRPSPFDFFSDGVSEFALAGVRVRWALFDGGVVRREAEALRLQARVADTEEAAFIRQLARDVADDRTTLARLDTALADDARVVALREEVVRVAARQLDEGVILPDTYADRLADLARARLTLDRHRIERARAQARLLSTLGRFPEREADLD